MIKEKLEQMIGDTINEKRYWLTIRGLSQGMPPKPSMISELENYYYYKDESVLSQETVDYILNCAGCF